MSPWMVEVLGAFWVLAIIGVGVCAGCVRGEAATGAGDEHPAE